METMLDIGAGDGLLLKIVKEQLPHIQVAACEKDRNTLSERQKVVGQNTFDELADLIRAGQTFSAVSLFHVLEHILDPAAFLHEIRQVLTPESLLIIEIPSLTCPLLSLYNSQAYRRFYFQRQHPFNYSHASLRRLMEYHQFQTLDLISFQRYGFENHLNWLLEGKPGGNEEYKALFARTNLHYITDLEQAQQTDSVIWIGKHES
jgi:ubiquinone/menaquinone biosynthesis C-methylase UbiE